MRHTPLKRPKDEGALRGPGFLETIRKAATDHARDWKAADLVGRQAEVKGGIGRCGWGMDRLRSAYEGRWRWYGDSCKDIGKLWLDLYTQHPGLA